MKQAPSDFVVEERLSILTVRDLSDLQVAHVRTRLQQLVEHGLPNYLDRQRFGSYCPGSGFIAAHILARDPEQAVCAYLAGAQRGDPVPVRDFRRVAADGWATGKSCPSTWCSLAAWWKS